MAAGLSDHRGMDPYISAQQIWLILAGVVCGALVQGFTGFGFAIVAVPVMGLVLAPAEVLPYVMALQVVLGLTGLRGAVGHCRWPMVAWLGLGLAVGTPVGVVIITHLSPPMGRIVIAAAVSAAFVIILFSHHLTVKVRLPSILGAGLAAGIMNGLAGLAGPPVVALLISARLEPREARATLVVFILIAALAALIPLGLAGRIGGELMAPLILGVPVLAGGWALGSRGFHRTSASAHRKAALAVMGVLAVASFGRATLPFLHLADRPARAGADGSRKVLSWSSRPAE